MSLWPIIKNVILKLGTHEVQASVTIAQQNSRRGLKMGVCASIMDKDSGFHQLRSFTDTKILSQKQLETDVIEDEADAAREHFMLSLNPNICKKQRDKGRFSLSLLALMHYPSIK